MPSFLHTTMLTATFRTSRTSQEIPGAQHQGERAESGVIVFCGVRFMGKRKTAVARLTVLLPICIRDVHARTWRPGASPHTGKQIRHDSSSLCQQHGRGEGTGRHLLHLRQRGKNSSSIPEEGKSCSPRQKSRGANYDEKMNRPWTLAGVLPDSPQSDSGNDPRGAERHPEAIVLVTPNASGSRSRRRISRLSTGDPPVSCASRPENSFIIGTETGTSTG